FYLAYCFACAYAKWPTVDALTTAQLMGLLFDNLYKFPPCIMYAHSNWHKLSDAPGAAGPPKAQRWSLAPTDMGIYIEPHAGIVFDDDGHTCWIINNGSYVGEAIQLISGVDRILFSTQLGAYPYQYFYSPPPGNGPNPVAAWTYYYVQNVQTLPN